MKSPRNPRRLVWAVLNTAANLIIVSWFVDDMPDRLWLNIPAAATWTVIAAYEAYRDFIKEPA